jgi:CHAT domain-containing protein
MGSGRIDDNLHSSPAVRHDAVRFSVAVDPTLPALREEEAVLRTHGGRAIRLDEFSNKDAIPSIWHVAGHGLLDNVNPLESAVPLGEGSSITARFIQSLDLSRTNCVFLNCCRTAAGGSSHTSEQIGLAWAALAAGARFVIGSQWEVRDDVACRFATLFYENLRDGKPVSGAFARAQSAMFSEVGSEDPASVSAYSLRMVL